MKLIDGQAHGEKIGKDDVRILSRTNFDRRIDELKQDSKADEQDDLLRGIYIIRQFCLEKKTNLFVVQERMLQQNDQWRALFNRLLDYRIIHNWTPPKTSRRERVGLIHSSRGGADELHPVSLDSDLSDRRPTWWNAA